MEPTFLIIGAQKAGTTSLHEYLGEHPDVGMPTKKEVHYYDHAPRRSAGWYRSHFPLRGGCHHTGEATPFYLFHPAVPARVRAGLPDVRLIVLLRDPVERAYSQHNYEVALGFEELGFAEAIAREPERLAADDERWRAEPGFRSYAHEHHAYVARGLYAQQLENWYAEFPRDQMFVMASEKLFVEPAESLHEVQRWLGLGEHTPAELTARNAGSYAPIDPALREELKARFAEDEARLRDLVAIDLPWSL